MRKELTMKRIFFLLAIVALALPAGAVAKGPSEASLEGPGLGKTITIKGTEEPGSPLGDLTQSAGFFPAVFEQQPDPMRSSRPAGNLGPKYTIDYTVPGPEGETFHITQDAYPCATPRRVAFTKPGQKIFDSSTRGGWYVDELDELKARLGVPATAPAGGTASSAGFFSAGRLGAAAALVLLLGGAAWFYTRRRPRQALA
jgi:hypothetical protein